MKQLILIIFVATIISCNNRQNYSAKNVLCDVEEMNISTALENKDLIISDIVDSVKIITLETTEKSILSSINQVIIGDNFIYIRDNYESGGVAIFKKDGSFLKRLSHGGGPGEINRAMRISYDKYNKKLLVDDTRNILIYNEKGDFIKDISPEFIYADFIAFKDKYLFFQLDIQNKETNLPSFIITDTLFKAIDKFYLNKKRYVMGGDFLSYTDNQDEVTFFRPLDNSIYSIGYDGKIVTKYKLSFPDLEANTDKYNECRDNTFWIELNKEQKGKCYFVGDFAETNNYLFFRFDKIRKGDVYVYINKKTKEVFSGINPFMTKELPNMGLLAGSYGNYFVKYLSLEFFGGFEAMSKIIEANKKFLSEDDLTKLKNYKDDDNPILILYKMK
jgi:hypothetical protein